MNCIGLSRKRLQKYVHSLIVTSSFTGSNTGKRIMTAIEEQVLGQSINLIRLDCIASNKRFCVYYESIGFIKKGEKQMLHSLNNLYEKML